MLRVEELESVEAVVVDDKEKWEIVDLHAEDHPVEVKGLIAEANKHNIEREADDYDHDYVDLDERDLHGIDFHDENMQYAHLRYTNLQAANLQKTYLRLANMKGANLQDAHLEDANLQGAKLDDADCRRAHFNRTMLQAATAKWANLSHAELPYAILRGTYLDHANLRSANLHDAQMFEARLVGAKLHSANLSGADMRHTLSSGAVFKSATLHHTDLMASDLRGANFRCADLFTANLTDAHLQGADLRHAKLQGVNLRHADLKDAKFEGAEFFPSQLKAEQLQQYLNYYAELYIDDQRYFPFDENIGLLRKLMRTELIAKINDIQKKYDYDTARKLFSIAIQHPLFARHQNKKWFSFRKLVSPANSQPILTKSQQALKDALGDEGDYRQLRKIVRDHHDNYSAYARWAEEANLEEIEEDRLLSSLQHMDKAGSEKFISHAVTLTALHQPLDKNDLAEYIRTFTQSDLHDEHGRINLRGADLSETDVSNIDMDGVNLRRANLHKADLSGSNLASADIAGAWLLKARFFPRENLLEDVPRLLNQYAKWYLNNNNLAVLKPVIVRDLLQAICGERSDLPAEEKLFLLEAALRHPLIATHRDRAPQLLNRFFARHHDNVVYTASQRLIAAEIARIKPQIKREDAGNIQMEMMR